MLQFKRKIYERPRKTLCLTNTKRTCGLLENTLQHVCRNAYKRRLAARRIKEKIMSTTSFGKEIRKLRIDSDQTQKDLAKLLGVSPAFLSAVESGKKQVPKKWIEKIAKIYQLSPRDTERLQAAIVDSSSAVKIDLRSASNMKRRLATRLAWKFADLDDETAEKILQLLDQQEKSH